eukprot:764008-Hanusia_phi.AAC.1
MECCEHGPLGKLLNLLTSFLDFWTSERFLKILEKVLGRSCVNRVTAFQGEEATDFTRGEEKRGGERNPILPAMYVVLVAEKEWGISFYHKVIAFVLHDAGEVTVLAGQRVPYRRRMCDHVQELGEGEEGEKGGAGGETGKARIYHREGSKEGEERLERERRRLCCSQILIRGSSMMGFYITKKNVTLASLFVLLEPSIVPSVTDVSEDLTIIARGLTTVSDLTTTDCFLHFLRRMFSYAGMEEFFSSTYLSQSSRKRQL